LSDIFISYASADRERARVIAEALAERGWSVWWDRVIPPGRQFDEVIEEALDATRCVVVLWSRTSTASTWVKTEAAEAMSRKVLIPAIIEQDVKIPLEFRRLQAADLSRWNGDRHDPQLEQFFGWIEAALGRTGPIGGERPPPVDKPREEPPRVEPAPPPPDRPAPQPGGRKLSPALIGAIVGLIVVALGAAYYIEHAKNAALAEQAERLRVEREAERDRAARDDADRARRADEERTAAEGRRARQPAPAPAVASRPGTPPQQSSAPKAVPTSGTASVNWRDHALGYGGTLAWNATGAMLQVSVVDLSTNTPIGSYRVPAYVAQLNPTEYMVTAQFAVPGDSTTPGPHTHMSRLLFRAQNDGSVRLIQNCPRQGECY
jgi:hypothetical protein